MPHRFGRRVRSDLAMLRKLDDAAHAGRDPGGVGQESVPTFSRINISAAARDGVVDAVRTALGQSARWAYERRPELPDSIRDQAEAWGDE